MDMDNYIYGKMHPQQQQQMLQPEQQQPISINEYQAHMMPTPTTSPWNLNTMPWSLASSTVQPGAVMEFTAAMTDRKWQLHQKRKSETTISIPPKQFISEEKITAHFNGLHISSDYIQSTSKSSPSLIMGGEERTTTTTGKCFTNLTYEDYQITAKELEQKLLNANRITLCDEIRKLTEDQRKVSFLPEALMNRVSKPCTALVLWQPPPILEILKQQTQSGSAQQTMRNDMTRKQTDNDFDLSNEFESNATDAEIDDFLDNNNTCSVDFNNLKPDSMDEDL